MRLLSFAMFLCFFTTSLSAQIGFTGAYFTQSIPDWELAVFGQRSNEDLYKTGYSGEIDYKITPLENYRVEFFPTLTYNLAKTTNGSRGEIFDLSQYEFGIKANIFLLSLEADCDCPTFSREAGLLEKGFFVQIAPGISYFDGKIQENEIDNNDIISEGSGTSFKLGLGMGLEIGFSDFITLTPLIKYNRYFNINWEGLKEDINQFNQSDNLDGSDSSAINQFYAGLRLGIRFRR